MARKFNLFMAVMIVLSCAAPGLAAGTKVIDNFERNSDLKNPEWWKFDNITATVVPNPAFRPGDKLAQSAGRYSLKIKGGAKDWYCGGIGTYLGIDATGYTGVEILAYGNGAGSGRIKIELYDDDKGSWQTQYDKGWIPLKDDLYAYEQNIDWRGWKLLYVPFSQFNLTNPKRGDSKMNFDQNNGSGGLLQLQIIAIANSKDGEVNFNLDNIKLVTREESNSDEE